MIAAMKINHMIMNMTKRSALRMTQFNIQTAVSLQVIISQGKAIRVSLNTLEGMEAREANKGIGSSRLTSI